MRWAVAIAILLGFACRGSQARRDAVAEDAPIARADPIGPSPAPSPDPADPSGDRDGDAASGDPAARPADAGAGPVAAITPPAPPAPPAPPPYAVAALDCPEQDDGTGSAGTEPLRDDAVRPDWTWERKVRRIIDRTVLEKALRGASFEPPEGYAIYAARVVEGVGGPAYVAYQAGAGAFSQDFWPASTVKVLAALGALDFARSLGFTGAAEVAFDAGPTDTLRAIVDRAIRVSSNDDYDLTVLVAGLDRLNDEFLTPANGFPTTILERSYGAWGVRRSPALTLTEAGRSRRVEARRGRASYGCPDGGNCADLFELTEAIRRVVLRAEVSEAERFALDPADLAALDGALCNAESSCFLDGARAAFGAEPRICHKTGSVRDDEALDHGLLEDPSTGARYLLAAAIPTEGDVRTAKERLSELAERVLRALAHGAGGPPLQPDAGIPVTVQVDPAGDAPRRRGRFVLTIEARCADRVEVWLDGRRSDAIAGKDFRFTFEPRGIRTGDHLLIVVASRGSDRIGYRSLRIRFGP